MNRLHVLRADSTNYYCKNSERAATIEIGCKCTKVPQSLDRYMDQRLQYSGLRTRRRCRLS